MTEDPIIGIDLGTTNSEVAIIKDGRIQVVEEDGTAIMPSCVGLDTDGTFLVGSAARNQYVLRPDSTVRSIKRKMGSSETVQLSDSQYTPQEISAMLLQSLKKRAEAALGCPVRRAVITVPAYFTDQQRNATREAGVLAGLTVERLLNEPTAAALAYELSHEAGKKTILIYDLGGGTFDVSVLHMENDVVEVLATHGNNHLGGDDIDALLHTKALDAFCEQHPGKELSTAGTLQLGMACEQLKIDLSEQASSTLISHALSLADGTTAGFEWTVTRSEFDDWTYDFFTSTLTSVRIALEAAKCKAADLDEILLVGGSTRSPFIVDMLEDELGKRPRRELHPELAVAYGAGVMAGRISGDGSHRILLDITPYTFGISCLSELNGEVSPYRFVPIIKAGTPLPCGGGDVFYTCADGQKVVSIDIYQGESDDARQNQSVGTFEVENLDKKAPAGSIILVNMKLDLNGLLKVTAIEKATGLSKSIVVKNALQEMTEEQLAASRKRVEALTGVDADVPQNTWIGRLL